MDLELSDDQAELRSIARDLLSGRGDLAPAREMLDGAGDPGPLTAEVIELGWPQVGLDEDDPFGIPGLCLLAEQVGYHAAPVAIVDLAVVARLARAAEAAGWTLPPDGAAGGPGALAVVEPTAGWSLTDLAATATAPAPGSLRIDADKLGVHHGATAALFAVLVTHDGEPAAALVAAGAGGVETQPAAGLDPSAAPADLTLRGVTVDAPALVAGAVLRDAFAVGTVATAAESVGAASRALELANAYALDRRQFGRPIGSFQALAHRLAEMFIRREAAWSAVLYAAAALEQGLPEAPAAVSVAKAYAAGASREIVEGALQVLGGIGFTWEHDAHLLQRRVLESERRFGDAIDHERALSVRSTTAGASR